MLFDFDAEIGAQLVRIGGKHASAIHELARDFQSFDLRISEGDDGLPTPLIPIRIADRKPKTERRWNRPDRRR